MHFTFPGCLWIFGCNTLKIIKRQWLLAASAGQKRCLCYPLLNDNNIFYSSPFRSNIKRQTYRYQRRDAQMHPKPERWHLLLLGMHSIRTQLHYQFFLASFRNRSAWTSASATRAVSPFSLLEQPNAQTSRIKRTNSAAPFPSAKVLGNFCYIPSIHRNSCRMRLPLNAWRSKRVKDRDETRYGEHSRSMPLLRKTAAARSATHGTWLKRKP